MTLAKIKLQSTMKLQRVRVYALSIIKKAIGRYNGLTAHGYNLNKKIYIKIKHRLITNFE